MDRAKKKQKQRLKRERKRVALRKAQSGSPARQYGGGELVACYMNDDWRERGQAVAFVLRRGRDGRLAMATFLVDLWCAGLKDAWGRVGLSRDDFENSVDRISEQLHDTMDDAPLAEVAAVVAGGIRFARRNGFRLPHHYDRWAAFLGDLHPDLADLTHFGVEGGTKLRWVAPMHDLRARLIGSTVEQFLARPDVEFIIIGAEPFDDFGFDPRDGSAWGDDQADDDDDDEGEDADIDGDRLGSAEEVAQTFEVLDSMVKNASASLRRWCFANGRVPEKKIEDALPMVIARGFASIADEADPMAAAEAAEIRDREARILEALPEPERLRLQAAILQVEEFLRDRDDPQQFLAAFGLPGPGEDEEV